MGLKNSFSLNDFITHCTQETLRADADMQLAQRDAWRSMNAGNPTIEGFDHAAFLGVSTVNFSLHLEPAISWWRRFLANLRIWPLPAEPWDKYRLCPKKSATDGAIDLNVTVHRKPDGSFETTTQPSAKELEGVNVAH